MRIYYEVIETRLKLLRPRVRGYLPVHMELESLAASANDLDEKCEDRKPIERDGTHPLSLFLLNGIPSVKLTRLGAGSFARTYLHADGLPGKDEDHYYAVKVFSYSLTTNYSETVIPDSVKREMDVLKRLGRFIRYDVRKSEYKIKYYVVEKFIPGKTLMKALDDLGGEQSLEMHQVLTMMLKLCQSLQIFHATGYSHGDLKADNIMVEDLLNADPQFTLIDFNWASLPNQRSSYDAPVKLGSREQIPPECCHNTIVYLTPAVDIYALGAVFARILDKTKYTSGSIESCDELIEKMRHNDPGRRPAMEEIIKAVMDLKSELSVKTKHQHLGSSIGVFRNKYMELPAKKQVTDILTEYISGLRQWRWFSSENNYAEKSELFRKLIFSLQSCNTQQMFYETLKQAVVEYVFRFVSNNLHHHIAECTDLGAGLSCFLRAVKACGKNFILYELINEVSHTLPRLSGDRAKFMADFARLSGYSNSPLITLTNRSM